MRIVRLSRELCRERVAALVALDAALRREMGERYSTEDWGEENFVRELPGKWELSHLAEEEGATRGFWIASDRGAWVHIHRVGVAATHRGRGLGSLLFAACRERAEGLGRPHFTVCLAAGNEAAHAFYERLGFHPASPQTLQGFLAGTGTEARDFQNVLLERG